MKAVLFLALLLGEGETVPLTTVKQAEQGVPGSTLRIEGELTKVLPDEKTNRWRLVVRGFETIPATKFKAASQKMYLVSVEMKDEKDEAPLVDALKAHELALKKWTAKHDKGEPKPVGPLVKVVVDGKCLEPCTFGNAVPIK